jgi:hypothetical protein
MKTSRHRTRLTPFAAALKQAAMFTMTGTKRTTKTTALAERPLVRAS